jgi:hypothetical protein
VLSGSRGKGIVAASGAQDDLRTRIRVAAGLLRSTVEKFEKVREARTAHAGATAGNPDPANERP